MHALYGQGGVRRQRRLLQTGTVAEAGRHFKPKPHNQLNSNRCLAPLFGKGAESCSCCSKQPSTFPFSFIPLSVLLAQKQRPLRRQVTSTPKISNTCNVDGDANCDNNKNNNNNNINKNNNNRRTATTTTTIQTTTMSASTST